MMHNTLPPPSAGQNYVSVTPINGGKITLPEKSFVFPSDPEAVVTVPSLSFLIAHPGVDGRRRPRYLLFDLGLRGRLQDYMKDQQSHLSSRVPYELGPSVAQSLGNSGLNPDHIDTVILSHLHYDHHGDPGDFPRAQFFVGPGSLKLLSDGLGINASHQVFDPDLFHGVSRVSELPSPSTPLWQPLGPFKATLDLLHDGSIYVIDAPGHLPGHINLLCRLGPKEWMYLGGDSCHDLRLLSGEREIATWVDAHGHRGCIHVDKDRAEETLSRIWSLQQMTEVAVEVVMAHDVHWWETNQYRALPALGH
ncbi:uncharacterized protein N7496_004607 [Penicillium cataractarum]|uniref:Metallo-beta-lactamase domain-containing protein n=1 Tax=Penicillium cataractarum TaxID=2100454 RepID=A0A9W9VCM7_9EURO|nr:uncharacterized protein N7496_004607 [Penicillium cataractarum]KAJ5377198.1 hypothetical protein N7496_004607 [Penicillium cataractarum]